MPVYPAETDGGDLKHLIFTILGLLLFFTSGCEQEEEEQFTPVLLKGDAGKWDDFSVADPHVYADAGTFHMYYAGNANSWSDPFEIGYATSTDGITWTKPEIAALGNTNRVIPRGGAGTWNVNGVTNPCVVKISDTEYHMWFAGMNGSDTWQIGYASSSDGITWVEGANPVLSTGAAVDDFDRVHVFDPYVVYEGGTFHIWYTGVDNSNFIATGYTSTATAGASLLNAADPVLEQQDSSYFAGGIRAPSVLLDAGTWWMWPTASTGVSGGYTVSAAQSSDPDTGWLMNSVPVLKPHTAGFDSREIGLASVVKYGAGFRMWYTGWAQSGESLIGYASSSNGITWTRYKE
jgi:predicted GH43/DUF377 family glycosyl hydrolase